MASVVLYRRSRPLAAWLPIDTGSYTSIESALVATQRAGLSGEFRAVRDGTRPDTDDKPQLVILRAGSKQKKATDPAAGCREYSLAPRGR
jgi:hypothetical protein